METYLISGKGSGLGKYLYNTILQSEGFGRNEYSKIKSKKYDTIIHCAFNKEMDNITDYYQYLNDNILLTKKLLELDYTNFIYISSVDVYQSDSNYYVLFKKLSESLVSKYNSTYIFRCSMMLGPTMKPNHFTKIKANQDKIGLSENSTFNYIDMEDIKNCIISKDYKNNKSSIIDFVSNQTIKLSKVKQLLNSNTSLGDYTYNTLNVDFQNPVYTLNRKYNKSSLETIKKYTK